MRRVLSVIFFTAIFSAHSSLADEARFVTTKVKEGLYVLQGEGGFTGGNIAVSVGEDGVVMIDDSMPPFLDKLKAAVLELTRQKIDFLINTHVHGDHTGNNASFGEAGAHIVAHHKLRERLKTMQQDTPKGKKPTPPSALPVITFSNEITFHLNGSEIQVFHVENAHTDGDAVIHFVDLNVIHTGDALFNGLFPFIDLDSGGSVSGYIAAQKRIYEMAKNDTVIIPGHGPIGKRADLEASITMLEDARASVQKLIAKGKSEEEIVQLNPLKKYHDKWNWGFITTEKMTRTLYKDLKG